jgi:hypothetical protein
MRPFSRPCGENSIPAGIWPFRASQLFVRAGKNPSVRPFFDLCGEYGHAPFQIVSIHRFQGFKVRGFKSV